MNFIEARKELLEETSRNYDEKIIFSVSVEKSLATWIAMMASLGFSCTAGNSDGRKCEGLWYDNGEEFSERRNQYCINLNSRKLPFSERWHCNEAEINEVVFTDEGVAPDDTFSITIS